MTTLSHATNNSNHGCHDSGDDRECWRCGSEGAAVAMPMHPDGGGMICHRCYQRIYSQGCPECADHGYTTDMIFGQVELVACPLCNFANLPINFNPTDDELAAMLRDYESRGVDLVERDEELESVEYGDAA